MRQQSVRRKDDNSQARPSESRAEAPFRTTCTKGKYMVPSIGNVSSLGAIAASPAPTKASSPNPAAAQAIKDSLNISQQAQAASARIDSDGDHDGS